MKASTLFTILLFPFIFGCMGGVDARLGNDIGEKQANMFPKERELRSCFQMKMFFGKKE